MLVLMNFVCHSERRYSDHCYQISGCKHTYPVFIMYNHWNVNNTGLYDLLRHHCNSKEPFISKKERAIRFSYMSTHLFTGY